MALVVIIVVMIILSGVAVVGIASDGGIFKKIGDMRGNMENQIADSQNQIDSTNAINDVTPGTLEKAIITDAYIDVPDETLSYDKATVHLDILKYDAKSLDGLKIVYTIGNNGEYYPADNDRNCTFTNLNKNTTYRVYAYEQYVNTSGEIQYAEIKNREFTTKDRPAIGSTITYIHPPENQITVSGTYSGYKTIRGFQDQTYKGSNDLLKLYTWRILSIDGTTVELVSDAATKIQVDNYCFLRVAGTRGFNNYVKLSNDICSTIYSTPSKVSARSMNLNDIRKYLTPTKLAELESGNNIEGGSYWYYGYGQTWPTAFSGNYLSIMPYDENVMMNGAWGSLRADEQTSYISDNNNGVSSSSTSFIVKDNTWGDIFPYGTSVTHETISLGPSDFKTNPDTNQSYFYILKPSYNDTSNPPTLATRGYGLRKKKNNSTDSSISFMFMYFLANNDTMQVGGAWAKTFSANSGGSGSVESPSNSTSSVSEYTFRPIIKVDISRLQKINGSWTINLE